MKRNRKNLSFMVRKPTYEELKKSVKELGKEAAERKRAEKAARESEEKFKAITASAKDAIIMMDDEGNISYWNEAAEKIFVYSADEALGKELHMFLAPQKFHDAYRRGILTFRKTGYGPAVDKTLELEAVRKDGATFPIELSVSAVKIEEKWHATGIVRDVSERRQKEQALQKAHDELEQRVAERTKELTKANEKLKQEVYERKRIDEALRQSRERLALALDASNCGMWDFNPHTFGDAHYNDTWFTMLGYEPDDVPHTAETSMKLIHPEDLEPVSKKLQVHIKKKTPYSAEFRMKTKDGSYRWIRSIGRIVSWDNNGNPQRMVGIHIDINDRKTARAKRRKLEAQLQQVQKLEAMGTLAGGIAHDFNNLLMTVHSNVSLMLYDIDSMHPHYEALKDIEKQVRSGAKLTGQLLGYARKGRYDPKPVDLNSLVQGVAETFGRTRKDITVHQQLAEDLFAIEADHGQIEQVLLNLCVNAADAMPGGGDLMLQTMNVAHEDMKGRLYHPKPGNYVLLTVTDTGTGMDKETQQRVFDPFFTTKQMGQGTGIGLASVYGIIDVHGGHIDVDSEKGRGTTFSIYLPATETSVDKTIKAAEQIVKGTGTILLVDDEEMVLKAGIKLLKKLGYTVLGAGGGNEALEIYKAKKDNIDLVILDMVMPNTGGGETYDRMKNVHPNVKVLLSSGYSIDGQAQEILQRGCDGFIQKPFSIAELSEKIREVLGNK
ncbi:MAG: PAS domain S-box protein [Desulfobacterales bacterium]|nr:PAS domain S-box protein [Desulfobacterales bacterium]